MNTNICKVFMFRTSAGSNNTIFLMDFLLKFLSESFQDFPCSPVTTAKNCLTWIIGKFGLNCSDPLEMFHKVFFN